MANRPHTNVLAEKSECYVGTPDSREQVPYFAREKPL